MIKINEKFKPLYQEETRYYIITGERGSSKSFSVADYLLRKTYQKNQIIYFTRYTLSSAKDSIIPEFNEKLELLNCENDFNVNRTEIVNKFSNSEIKFRGIKASQGSQTAKLKGLTGATVWVIDEGEEFTDENLFNKLNKSLRVKDEKNIIIFVLNPTYKKHFIYKRFFRNAGVNEHFNGIKNNVTYIHLTWKDNERNLDEDFIKEAVKLQKENPQQYKREYLSGWLDPEEGLVCPTFRYFSDNIEFSENNTRVAYIDTADKGKDYYSMPIFEVIGDYVYLIDVIHTSAMLKVTQPLTIAKINELKLDTVIIETNKEGGLYVSNIEKETNCNIIGKFNTTKKETRILSQAGWLTKRVLIKKPENQNLEYSLFMEHVQEYEKTPKEHQFDDAIDALAGLAKYCRVALNMPY